jgi:hypothetical protein
LSTSGFEHGAQRGFEALEVGDQDFDPAAGRELANEADGFGEDFGAAEVVVVAIHAGDDGVLQAERGDGFGDALRFVQVNGAGAAFGNGAETASACADVAEQHEGRGLVVPALADVGALRGFADGVQAEAPGKFLELVKVLADRSFGAQPRGLGLARGRREFDLDEL